MPDYGNGDPIGGYQKPKVFDPESKGSSDSEDKLDTPRGDLEKKDRAPGG